MSVEAVACGGSYMETTTAVAPSATSRMPLSPLPDLSLNISPPTVTSPPVSSSSPAAANNNNLDLRFDSSSAAAATELSLSCCSPSPTYSSSPPASFLIDSFSCRRTSSAAPLRPLPVESFSSYNSLRPIKGIPVNLLYGTGATNGDVNHKLGPSYEHHYTSPFPPQQQQQWGPPTAFPGTHIGPGTYHRIMTSAPVTTRFNGGGRLASAQQGGQYYSGGGFTAPTKMPGKRSMRAPRMRWTSTLHARFVHAVELLGGHERATPKSVLELMDVKDLTLAHVKSHLQMYRTVKTTDRPAPTASSGHSEGSGDDDLNSTNADLGFRRFVDHRSSYGPLQHDENSSATTRWSNSSRSRTAWFQANSSNIEGLKTRIFSSQTEECNISLTKDSMALHRDCRNPSLEFTLGRPDWQGSS